MAEHYLRKYGAEAKINFELYETDGLDLKTDASAAAGDVILMRDEAAEANSTALFVDEGRGYSITFPATVMNAARVVAYVEDQTTTKLWMDQTLIIETYGNASGQHEFDLDSDVWSSTVEAEGSYTAKDVLSIALAVLAGETTSAGATFKTPNGTATRVTATVNASNERTAMVLDPSS